MLNFYYWYSKSRISFAFFVFGCLVSMGVRAQTLGSNLLENGDAEDAAVVAAGKKWVDGGTGASTFGNATGTDGGVWFLTNTCNYPSGSPMRASHGNQFFSAGTQYAAGDVRTLTQQIDLPVSFTSQDLTYTFDSYLATNGIIAGQYNQVEVTVEYRDPTENVAYSFDYSLVPTSSSSTGWVHVTDTHNVLATDNVTHIVITLTAGQNNTFANIEAYFDNISLVGNLTSLPVSLLDFHAVQAADRSVALHWETAQEQNSSYMEVERSPDGKGFVTIGKVMAAGNSSLQRQYNFTDADPLSGRGFYRLRMVDLDGSFKYSKTLQVTTAAAGSAVKVFSNPFHDVLGVRIPAAAPEKMVLSLLDQSGRVCVRSVYSAMTGINFVNLDGSGLAAGVYLLRVQGGRTEQTIRVLKQ